MTRDDIIKLARETDLVPSWMQNIPEHQLKWIEDFAALVAAAEREACAKVADSMDPLQDGAIGNAIRARGQL